LKISFTYQKYYTDAPEQKVVKPLALKVYRYRWYLIAVDRDDRRYGLDRISNLKILSDHFAPHNVDINEIQKHSFGVEVAKDYTPQKIVLSFTPEAGKYAKSLPWHDSQEILIDNDKELRISLYVYPTEDFKMEILSQSKNIKVIEPQSLVDEMKEIYRGALGRYE
jgi:predicted DNA-binding transcriptional regulator YafY